MSLNTAIEVTEDVNFRYGQDFTYFNAKVAWRRKGYANRLVVGVVDEAIGKGFHVIDVKTKKPVKNDDEIREVLELLWLDIKKACYYDRAYGKSLGMFFYETGMTMPIFRAFDINNYFVKYNELAIAEQYDITDKVGGMFTSTKTRQVIDNDLNAAYEIIIREDDTKGEGLSVLEPVWDTLFALSSLDAQGTYYGIRYGAGIRYMKIPESKFNNPAFMSQINKMLKGAIGANGVYNLPYETVAGVKEELEINSEDAVQIRFLELKKLLLGTLAGQTGIPLEIWEGSMLGLRSSEKNEDKYFDYLQGVQDDYRRFFKWIVYMLNSFFQWFPDTTLIALEYVYRETLDEGEKLAQLSQKLDIASKAGFNVPMEWLVEQLGGMPLEEKSLDPLGINPNIDNDDDQPEDEDEEPDEDDDEDTEPTEGNG